MALTVTAYFVPTVGGITNFTRGLKPVRSSMGYNVAPLATVLSLVQSHTQSLRAFYIHIYICMCGHLYLYIIVFLSLDYSRCAVVFVVGLWDFRYTISRSAHRSVSSSGGSVAEERRARLLTELETLRRRMEETEDLLLEVDSSMQSKPRRR